MKQKKDIRVGLLIFNTYLLKKRERERTWQQLTINTIANEKALIIEGESVKQQQKKKKIIIPKYIYSLEWKRLNKTDNAKEDDCGNNAW